MLHISGTDYHDVFSAVSLRVKIVHATKKTHLTITSAGSDDLCRTEYYQGFHLSAPEMFRILFNPLDGNVVSQETRAQREEMGSKF